MKNYQKAWKGDFFTLIRHKRDGSWNANAKEHVSWDIGIFGASVNCFFPIQMAVPVVMCGCESWTIKKKAEHSRTDAFELWYWRRLLKVRWTAGSSKLSILKEISPEYSLEGLILKLQYSGHLMWSTNSLEKTLMLGKKWEQEEKGMTEGKMVGWHHQLNGHEFEQALGDGEAWCAAVHGVAKSWTWLSDWTTTKCR